MKPAAYRLPLGEPEMSETQEILVELERAYADLEGKHDLLRARIAEAVCRLERENAALRAALELIRAWHVGSVGGGPTISVIDQALKDRP